METDTAWLHLHNHSSYMCPFAQEMALVPKTRRHPKLKPAPASAVLPRSVRKRKSSETEGPRVNRNAAKGQNKRNENCLQLNLGQDMEEDGIAQGVHVTPPPSAGAQGQR
jgi:hypothetical protein